MCTKIPKPNFVSQILATPTETNFGLKIFGAALVKVLC